MSTTKLLRIIPATAASNLKLADRRPGGIPFRHLAIFSRVGPPTTSIKAQHPKNVKKYPVYIGDYGSAEPSRRLHDSSSENDEHENEIYQGILSTQIKLVKSFSLMTSAIGLACQPVLWMHAQSGQNLGIILAAGGFVSFFTFVTPLFIHFLSKKYVTKLYYNEKQEVYTAVTYNFFVRPKKVEFKINHVQLPKIPAMFTTFKAKDIPLFVDGVASFSDARHFAKIMGLDKPIDTRWDHENNCSASLTKWKKRRKQLFGR